MIMVAQHFTVNKCINGTINMAISLERDSNFASGCGHERVAHWELLWSWGRRVTWHGRESCNTRFKLHGSYHTQWMKHSQPSVSMGSISTDCFQPLIKNIFENFLKAKLEFAFALTTIYIAFTIY